MRRVDDDPAAHPPTKTSDFLNRPFAICCILMVAHEVNGVFTMVNYASVIFAKSGSSMSPGISAIIVGAIQLIGSYVSSLLIDRLGRKVIHSRFAKKKTGNNRLKSQQQLLMVVSFAGAGVCHAILATYIYVATSTDIDVKSYNWLPVVAFSSMIFIAACGALPIPYVIMGEILPDKVRKCYFYQNMENYFSLSSFLCVLDSKYGYHIVLVHFMGIHIHLGQNFSRALDRDTLVG